MDYVPKVPKEIEGEEEMEDVFDSLTDMFGGQGDMQTQIMLLGTGFLAYLVIVGIVKWFKSRALERKMSKRHEEVMGVINKHGEKMEGNQRKLNDRLESFERDHAVERKDLHRRMDHIERQVGSMTNAFLMRSVSHRQPTVASDEHIVSVEDDPNETQDELDFPFVPDFDKVNQLGDNVVLERKDEDELDQETIDEVVDELLDEGDELLHSRTMSLSKALDETLVHKLYTIGDGYLLFLQLPGWDRPSSVYMDEDSIHIDEDEVEWNEEMDEAILNVLYLDIVNGETSHPEKIDADSYLQLPLAFRKEIDAKAAG